VRDEDLTASDGVRLKVSYFSSAQSGPGILLLHECGGSDRKSWSSLACLLAARGFHVLTLDFRGFGESGGARLESLDSERRDAEQARWPGDISLAFDHLMRKPVARSLALLSGGAGEAGIAHIRNSPWLLLTAPGGIDRALEAYREAKQRDPNAVLFPLSAVGSLGRQRMRSGNLDDPIKAFRLNLEAYPRSAAACDDLAEAYLRHGERPLATEYSEKTIQLLAGDPMLNSE
jgi:pimeloyl-ACP methyl ester carboxylesterase